MQVLKATTKGGKYHISKPEQQTYNRSRGKGFLMSGRSPKAVD